MAIGDSVSLTDLVDRKLDILGQAVIRPMFYDLSAEKESCSVDCAADSQKLPGLIQESVFSQQIQRIPGRDPVGPVVLAVDISGDDPVAFAV